MNQVSLTSCPFCGASKLKVLIVCEDKAGINKFYAVKCLLCGAQGPDARLQDKARELWNGRKQ